MSGYDRSFYDAQMGGSLRSAEMIVPLVMDLLQPESVVDVGCGVGTWLSAYKANGIGEVLGLDGDYVESGELKIDSGDFKATDLTTDFSVDRCFDLVQSLEVAEHLEKSHAQDFVRKLVDLGSVVLFSAAVPYQLGTNHVNEQLLPYWANLFELHGYQLIDCIRPKIWDNEKIEVCYRQNIVMFAPSEYIQNNAKLKAAYESSNQSMSSIIHPELYMPRIDRLINTALEAAQNLHKLGQLQLAAGVYSSLLNFNPHSAAIWSSHGQLAAQAGDLKVALASFTKAVECDANGAVHHFNLGQLYTMMQNEAQARVMFDKALSLQPDYPAAQAALSAINNK